jgi:CheY-like chemotaxis protein
MDRRIVLGVDDIATNLALIAPVVIDAGYVFRGASSGEECVALLGEIEPRFIMLDIEMPGMDGFETCRSIRANPRFRHVPIAFLSARKTTRDIRAAMAAGGNDFITLPFDPAKLRERVRFWAAHRDGTPHS